VANDRSWAAQRQAKAGLSIEPKDGEIPVNGQLI
jgi:hypothetical protein